ncbi:aminopeptidase n [Lasius niger]|uniref:Aminopeptidase n n=1 Tax=Lasius niger TaxID=67767 RepID=A0A0J7K1D3_LASNI|nr:aminopeptidase n [Lasius niger]
MANWIKDPYYPVINVAQDNPKLVIASLVNSNEVKSRWIPVSITTQSESIFDQTFFPHGQWIGLRNLTYCTFFLPYEENGWIIANLKQAGYYRVNYDSKNWQKIADFLDSPNYSEIDVLNRAQIIDDAFHLMITKKLSHITFWKLANYLSQEKEYIVWYPMIKALERMSNAFSLPENKTKRLRKKMMLILDNLLMEIKYEDEPDDSDHLKSLRKEIVTWACTLGIRECTDKAQQKMKKYVTNPGK